MSITSTPAYVATPGIQAAPVSLFDMTTRQTGTTQKALIFPTTITVAAMPTLASGNVAALKNSSNVCGGVFSPNPLWDSVLLDFAGQGLNAGDTVTVEIGRVKVNGAVGEILASVVLTATTPITLAVSVDPFTGVAHAAATWDFFEATTITANSALGDVLQALGGTSGNISQLKLNVHDAQYYYVQITAISDGGTRLSEFICDMTPVS